MTSISHAETLTLDDAIQKALAASYTLQAASLDVGIAETGIKSAKAEYYPSVRTSFNTEYLKDLDEGVRPVVSIGNTVIPTGTRYQNSAVLSMQQTVWDFGIRKRKVDMAEQEIASKSATYDQNRRDLQIKLVDTYVQALIAQRSVAASQSVLELAQQAYQMKQRLYQEGLISKVDVSEEAILVAQTLDEIESFKYQLQNQLNNMSYYTQEDYPFETTELANLDEGGALLAQVTFIAEGSPEAKAYDAQIERKQSEIEVLKRQNLPQVSLYSQYQWYGFDPDSVSKSFSDLSQRTFSTGLTVSLSVFDGFKNKAAIERAELELQKLVVEKQEKLAQLNYQAKTYEQQIEGFGVQLKTRATIVNKTQDKLTMIARLSEEEMMDRSDAIKQHIQRIRKQLEAEKALIESLAAKRKFHILATAT